MLQINNYLKHLTYSCMCLSAPADKHATRLILLADSTGQYEGKIWQGLILTEQKSRQDKEDCHCSYGCLEAVDCSKIILKSSSDHYSHLIDECLVLSLDCVPIWCALHRPSWAWGCALECRLCTAQHAWVLNGTGLMFNSACAQIDRTRPVQTDKNS